VIAWPVVSRPARLKIMRRFGVAVTGFAAVTLIAELHKCRGLIVASRRGGALADLSVKG